MKDQLFKNITEETLSRINIIEQLDDFDIMDVRKGMLSIYAKWSGPSTLNGNSILKLLNDSESKNFEIIIVDIDSARPEKQKEIIGTVCNGYFESVWIENGKIEFIYCDNNDSTELPKFKNFLIENLNKKL